MAASGEAKPIWASWTLLSDGRVHVVATYGKADGFVRQESVFDSLDQAAKALGPSFKDVVARASVAGSKAGRWRP